MPRVGKLGAIWAYGAAISASLFNKRATYPELHLDNPCLLEVPGAHMFSQFDKGILGNRAP